MISKINHDVEKVKSKAVYVFHAYTNSSHLFFYTN